MNKDNLGSLLSGTTIVLMLVAFIALMESLRANAYEVCYESVISAGNTTIICYTESEIEQTDCFDAGCSKTDLTGEEPFELEFEAHH